MCSSRSSNLDHSRTNFSLGTKLVLIHCICQNLCHITSPTLDIVLINSRLQQTNSLITRHSSECQFWLWNSDLTRCWLKIGPKCWMSSQFFYKETYLGQIWHTSYTRVDIASVVAHNLVKSSSIWRDMPLTWIFVQMWLY